MYADRVRVKAKVKVGLQTRQEDLLSHCFWQFDNVVPSKYPVVVNVTLLVTDLAINCMIMTVGARSITPVREMPSLLSSHAPALLPDHTAMRTVIGKQQRKSVGHVETRTQYVCVCVCVCVLKENVNL